MNITRIVSQPLKSSFLSCEKDAEEIIKRLFVTSTPYSNQLKKLLMINTRDCLDDTNEKYNTIVKNTSVKELMEEDYISLAPKVNRLEHEEIKSYIILTFDDFSPTSNPEFRDSTIAFDVLCHTDHWKLQNYQTRPIKIVGIIDGILNNAKLSGIGTLQFLHCQQLFLSNEWGGYTLTFRATHGSDDEIPGV